MSEAVAKTIVVTGASRGIGLGIADVLARAGHTVVAVARRETEALGAAMAAHDGRLRFAPFDLDGLDGIPSLVADLRKAHGRIYGLVNTAGIGTEGVLATMPTPDIERLVRLNTLAPMILTKHVVRSMMAAGDGRIVNMASIIASTGYSGLSVYAATKASMIGFTRSLAREVGSLGITVNAVAPGFVETEMTAGMDAAHRETIARRSALKRLATIEDVAEAVAYLMSAKARNITGTVMTIDAGNTA
jgi:3-oxoacyl-[acyl-carrier protein] reductase